MLALLDARARVARGATLLDRVLPGWTGTLDLGRLRLESCGHCILGQLYGHYLEAYRQIPVLRRAGGAHFGFDVTTEEFRGIRRFNYDTLTQAWLEAIADRVLTPVATAAVAVRA